MNQPCWNFEQPEQLTPSLQADLLPEAGGGEPVTAPIEFTAMFPLTTTEVQADTLSEMIVASDPCLHGGGGVGVRGKEAILPAPTLSIRGFPE